VVSGLFKTTAAPREQSNNRYIISRRFFSSGRSGAACFYILSYSKRVFAIFVSELIPSTYKIDADILNSTGAEAYMVLFVLLYIIDKNDLIEFYRVFFKP